MKKWLARMEYKFGRKAIPNLMMTVVIGMALVFVADLLNPTVNLQSYLTLDRSALLHGQVWRLLTFVFLPPDSSLLFIAFSLYFYYWIGGSLEHTWGAFRFNLYYLCGMLGAIAACLITGSSTNFYLNMSLFFAFAALYPDMQLMLFFVIPVKIKWLAWLDAAFYVYAFLISGWPVRAALLMSLVNFFLFFGPDLFRRIFHDARYWKTRAQFRRSNRR